MSHFHRYYSLGPFDKSVSVIFQYLGPNSATIHFMATADVPVGALSSEKNSIFKAPAGYRFTFEVCEVAIGAGDNGSGRFHLKFELHPSTEAAAMGTELTMQTLSVDIGLPVGECVGDGDCAGAGSIPCDFGKIPRCVDGTLECVDGQPEKANWE